MLRRLFIHHSVILVSLTLFLSACFHEEEEESYPYYESSFPSELAIFKQEDFVASYDGKLEKVALSTSDNCSQIKDRIVLAWEKEIAERTDNYCSYCVNNYYRESRYYFNPQTQRLLIDQNHIFYLYNKALYAIAFDESGDMSNVDAIEFDFYLTKIYLNESGSSIVVQGLENKSNVGLAKTSFMKIDIADTTDMKLLERFDFDNERFDVVNHEKDEMLLVFHSKFALPENLLLDDSFRELTSNFKDAKEMKSLYDYAVENVEGDVPQELVDFQRGAEVLVGVYQDLFDAKFNSAIPDFSELLPTFNVKKDELSETKKTLLCSNIYSEADLPSEDINLTQILKLDLSGNEGHHSIGLLGNHDSVSYADNRLLSVSHTTSGSDLLSDTTTLTSFKNSDAGITFEKSFKINGRVDRSGLAVIDKKMHMLMIQKKMSDLQYYGGTIGVVSYLMFDIDQEDFIKLAEEPAISFSWDSYLDGQVKFMKDGLFYVTRESNKQIYLNYQDPDDFSVQSEDIQYQLNDIIAIDDTHILLHVNEYGENRVNEFRIFDMANGLSVIQSYDLGENIWVSSQSMKIIKTNSGYVIAGQNDKYVDNGNSVELNNFFVAIDSEFRMTALGEIKHTNLIDNELCNSNNGREIDPACYGRPFYRVSSFVDVIDISDNEFAVTFSDKNIKLTQLENFNNSHEIQLDTDIAVLSN